MAHFDIGLVCMNGHVITAYGRDSAKRDTNFCSDCGEPIINACAECNAQIRGHHHVEGVVSFGGWDVPRYCHECGKPYPWTSKAREAITEAIRELEELAPEVRSRLLSSVPDIVADTPKSETAILRFKKALTSLGKSSATLLQNVIVAVATDAVKKKMGMP